MMVYFIYNDPKQILEIMKNQILAFFDTERMCYDMNRHVQWAGQALQLTLLLLYECCLNHQNAHNSKIYKHPLIRYKMELIQRQNFSRLIARPSGMLMLTAPYAHNPPQSLELDSQHAIYTNISLLMSYLVHLKKLSSQ